MDAYPPEFNGPEICEVCHRDIYHRETECDCPECPVCSEVGNLSCQTIHGLQPVRPECSYEAIRSIPDLAALVSSAHDTEASIARRMFKDTECGVVFAVTDNGVLLAGYAEGSDAELPSHKVDYPFTAETFWNAVESADREGCEEWDIANE